MNLEELEQEVESEANSRVAEILPLLLSKWCNQGGVVTCERHQRWLGPYVKAQLILHHSKKRYENCVEQGLKTARDISENSYSLAIIARDEARRIYRSTPCTCFIKKR